MLLADHPPWLLVPLGYLAVVTVPLAVTDVRTHRLPNALVVPGLVLLGWALAWAALSASGRALGGLFGAAVMGMLLAVGWMLGAVGMGDVKLGAWLGGLAGMTAVLEQPGAVARGVVWGAVLATALVVMGSAARPAAVAWASGPLRNPVAGLRIPFGPPLLAGFWVAAWTAGVHHP